jgi:hypothetical protein
MADIVWAWVVPSLALYHLLFLMNTHAAWKKCKHEIVVEQDDLIGCPMFAGGRGSTR